MKRPMLLCAAISIVSAFAVFYHSYAIFAAVIVVAVAALLSLSGKLPQRLLISVLCSVLVLLGISLNLLKLSRLESHTGKELCEEFVIIEQPFATSSGFYADAVCISDNTLKVGDKLRLFYSHCDLNVGDTVYAQLKLSDLNDSSYKKSCFSKGIYASGYVSSLKAAATKNTLLCTIPRLRREISKILGSADISYKAKSLISAVIAGDKSNISDEFDYLVKASGTSHMLVVSGMHLVILMGGITRLLERIFYNKYVYAAMSLFLVLLIMAICGFTMSVIRAGIMYLTVAAAPLFGRDSDALNTLGFTVCLIIAFTPFAIFSISLQLSAMSTLGILLLTRFITEKALFALNIVNPIAIKLTEAVAVTLSTTVMTAPICIYHFGYLSTVSIISNLLATYAVTALLLVGAMGISAGLVFGQGLISQAFLYLAGVCAEYTVKVIEFFGSLSFAILPLPDFTVPLFTVLAISISLLRYVERKRNYIISRRTY